MEAFILSIKLYAGAPIMTFQVKDCTVGLQWVEKARHWAKRSGFRDDPGPLFLCGPRSDRTYVAWARW
jgi:hypothetical protein